LGTRGTRGRIQIHFFTSPQRKQGLCFTLACAAGW
jgi:hypothetical protein